VALGLARVTAASLQTSPPGGDAIGGLKHGFDRAAQALLDQAKSLCRYWPEIGVGDQLFV
jgi:hypothetical protein